MTVKLFDPPAWYKPAHRPFCLDGEWYWRDPNGQRHGPYSSYAQAHAAWWKEWYGNGA